MRRIGVIGALVLILAILGGPALAQVDPSGGSALPPPGQANSQPLPPAGSSSGGTVSRTVASPALADTGIPVSTGVVLGVGLVAAGGGALVLARRRVRA